MLKRKVIIDTDPGYDDACALACASQIDQFDILGITTVAGNQTIENVTKNALNLANYLNLKCPVVKGMSEPIVKKYKVAEVHGLHGLDNVELPENNNKIYGKNAIQFIIESCINNDKITIITIGPLTNIAMAIKLEPKIKEHIELISIMGGSIGEGNVTPAAEFNIYDDPEAAQIIFSSGIKIRMYGLDVTTSTYLFENIIERFEKLNTKSSKLFVQCTKNLNINMNKFIRKPYGSMHDCVPIIAFLDENLIKYKKALVEIDLSHGLSYGRTNCDLYSENVEKSNIEVAVSINVDKFWDLVEELYKKY